MQITCFETLQGEDKNKFNCTIYLSCHSIKTGKSKFTHGKN